MTHTDPANIGIKSENAQKISDILQKYLATEVALNIKIRNYHWNVEGIRFHSMHEFFEELYTNGAEHVDEIAERIRMLGIHTKASMKEFLEMNIIPEESSSSLKTEEMIRNLLDDNELIIRNLRNDIDTVGELGDQGSEDFLTALIQKHEKDAWMLRSMTQ